MQIPVDQRNSKARRVAPGISKLKSDQIGIAATAEIEHASVGVWVRAYQRMHCTGGGKRIISRRHALTDIATAVVGAVVLYPEPGNALLQSARQRVIDGVHAAERCVASLRRHLKGVKHA